MAVLSVENYFNYFTEIEQRFQQRRGTGLILSTLDWALIETWKDAGVPLEAVLRGIDVTFDHYERRPSKTKKINGIAWCSQEVLTAAEEMKEASVGAQRETRPSSPGFSQAEVAAFLERNAAVLLKVQAPAVVAEVAHECAHELADRAAALAETGSGLLHLEDLERHLTVLEEKLAAALTTTAPAAALLQLRTEADREIAPYRSKMPAVQIEQLRKQFVHKRLFEQATIPRLSLFYM